MKQLNTHIEINAAASKVWKILTDFDSYPLIHSEVFSGLLVPFLANSLDTKTKSGFEKMNQALKARAES